MNGYIPKPMDTSDVEVPEDIKELMEIISRNTHEVWGKGRMEEGWVYGECLDYQEKTHPSLIPYEELSESEKDYDRRTSMETLKVILKMGYKITKGKSIT